MAGIKFTYKIIPLRLSRSHDNSVDIVVRLTNLDEEEKLISVEGKIVSHGLLGFDKNLTHKKAIKKVGVLLPGKSVEFPIRVYGSAQTKEGDYDVDLTLYEHFQDFNKVMESYTRRCTIRVI